MTQLREMDKTTQEQLLLETYLNFEQQHSTSDEPNILVRLRDKVELVGALQIGLFVACLTTFLNYLVVNLILHLS